MPAYPCDEWNVQNRVCWLNRNVGNTVTFVLTMPPAQAGYGKIRVEWKQEFRTSDPEVFKNYTIDQVSASLLRYSNFRESQSLLQYNPFASHNYYCDTITFGNHNHC
ncbi:hypothetical protein CEXT_776041 [Caerostris extrusa]|uniref:Uncharacterized protein n=1 Tax=Caerostris extrusa TaxID=172846 RepID=A0AAV4THJ3_CAEEX|nr:hypothetical protein CEXT_776041 [Caerostris extrusa]